jgi:uncharacterized membrane protein YoaK (UPF0700 family)
LRQAIERNRVWWETFTLASVLPGVAGAVNASGMVALGVYTSNMTGNVAHVGDSLAQREFGTAGQILLVIGFFILGAMAATALIEQATRSRRSARYLVPLLVEALLIALFALLSMHADRAEKHWRFQTQELEATLCFAMGLQNAMVTRLSGAVVRTTHLTGITTDLGIKIVRLAYVWADRLRGKPVLAGPDIQRFKLLLTIWLSFLAGATVGPALFLLIGSMAMLLPVFVLLLLALVDALLGLGKIYTPAGLVLRGTDDAG